MSFSRWSQLVQATPRSDFDRVPGMNLFHPAATSSAVHPTGYSAFDDNIGYCGKVDYGKISAISAHSGDRQKFFYPNKLLCW
jgi:hypothetical protein